MSHDDNVSTKCMSEVNSRTCMRLASDTCGRVNNFQRHVRESVRCFASFLSRVNWLLRFLTVRPWDPPSSLESLPVLIKIPKQEGLVVY